jgi:hypothetical protein
LEEHLAVQHRDSVGIEYQQKLQGRYAEMLRCSKKLTAIWIRKSGARESAASCV